MIYFEGASWKLQRLITSFKNKICLHYFSSVVWLSEQQELKIRIKDVDVEEINAFMNANIMLSRFVLYDWSFNHKISIHIHDALCFKFYQLALASPCTPPLFPCFNWSFSRTGCDYLLSFSSGLIMNILNDFSVPLRELRLEVDIGTLCYIEILDPARIIFQRIIIIRQVSLIFNLNTPSFHL